MHECDVMPPRCSLLVYLPRPQYPLAMLYSVMYAASHAWLQDTPPGKMRWVEDLLEDGALLAMG